MSDSIKKLQQIFRKFPTVGSRTAGRFVYYLVNQPKGVADELIAAIAQLKNSVKLCEDCFNPFEAAGQKCEICQSPARSKNILCIVEKEADLNSIESAGKYKGLYFILGSPPRLEDLKKYLARAQFSEIIAALNPTLEGRSSSTLLSRTLKEISFAGKVTHLALGLPVGGELEYADEETLQNAFEGRK